MSNSGKVTLENSIKGDIDLELIGNSVQPTTTGKNIFDESRAVTGRINPDNGELLPETFYISSDYIEVQEGETYFQSGSGDGYYRAFYDMNKKFTSIPTKGVFKITVPVGSKFLRISGRKERFGDWMIENGDKATPYEPYTGLKPSPSPDYPREIKSAGQKSKNLFDINYFKDKSNLKMLQCEGFTLLGIICNVKPNTNYTLSANITEAQYNLNIANKTQRFSLTSSSARTLMSNDDGTLYIGLFNTTADAVNMDDFMQQYKNIQLEEGDTATCYEAYSDKYLLDVKVTGKNLFDIEKAKDISNYTNSTNQPGYVDFSIYVGKGSTVTISYLEKLVANLGFYAGIAQTVNSSILYWLYHSSQNSLNKNAFKLIAQYDYICLRILKSKLQLFFDHIKTLQIEIGSKQTEYEPYTEQTLTLTSDRPLTKWDKLTEQDGEYGWLYNVEKITLTGEERWAIYDKQFYTTNYDIQRFDRAFCECYDYSDALNTLSKDCTFTIGAGIYSNSIFLKDDKYLRFLESGITDNTKSLEAFTQYLKEMLSKGTPIEILLKSKKSQFVPLLQEEQTQLRNLHSYNGTTHITVDSGEVTCGIKVAYKQKK